MGSSIGLRIVLLRQIARRDSKGIFKLLYRCLAIHLSGVARAGLHTQICAKGTNL